MSYHAMEMNRSAGVLLHPTCLPSPHGIGDLGPEARAYVEWLASAGVGWWQVLPLHPPGPGFSPYSAFSTFAGSPWMLSLHDLVDDGLLVADDVADPPSFPVSHVDFPRVREWKWGLLRRAWQCFRSASGGALSGELEELRSRHSWWLDDFSLYAALKAEHGGAAWFQWPRDLALCDPAALESARDRLAEEIGFQEFCQLVFSRQWSRLRWVAAEHGVRLLGDVPIFVAGDSADVWSRPELFLLDEQRRPTVVAGVPPDYFSATGQLWGNPLYDWQRHRADGYSWWISRLRHALELTDAVRIDHFRGFAAYWEVAAEAEVATIGRWVPGPGRELFDAVRGALGDLPLIAEDLGDITPDVIELRKQLGLPGMAILQFGFSPQPRSTFIPYAHERDMVVYSGTHDNNTSVGWFEEDASDGERELFLRYAGSDGSEVHWDMVRLAMASAAEMAIVPHQDLVGLGSEGRMNLPSVGEGNWAVRITEAMVDAATAERLRELVETYGRGAARREP